MAVEELRLFWALGLEFHYAPPKAACSLLASPVPVSRASSLEPTSKIEARSSCNKSRSDSISFTTLGVEGGEEDLLYPPSSGESSAKVGYLEEGLRLAHHRKPGSALGRLDAYQLRPVRAYPKW